MELSIIMIRRSWCRLIFILEIPVLLRWHIHIENGVQYPSWIRKLRSLISLNISNFSVNVFWYCSHVSLSFHRGIHQRYHVFCFILINVDDETRYFIELHFIHFYLRYENYGSTNLLSHVNKAPVLPNSVVYVAANFLHKDRNTCIHIQMMTSSNEKALRIHVIYHLWGKFTDGFTPLRVSNVEYWYFLCC